ncbi:MAG: hypothetical protein JO128_11320, partial [Alphaproteobacteria bacterium]|nr:hypothetical protein [Alphaproteobacteria bacterium]
MLDRKKPPFEPSEGGKRFTSDDLLPDTSQIDDTEAQMRRALGLGSEPRGEAPPRRAEQDSSSHRLHMPEQFSANRRKRRFVQDGEVPVTVVHGRRELGPDANAAPVNRVEAAEALAKAERSAREQAERALQDAQAVIHDLQTKQGHSELARTEAVAAARASAAEA